MRASIWSSVPRASVSDLPTRLAVDVVAASVPCAADSDWPEWARAAAVLQRWLEAAGRDADAERKLGYIHCTVEAQKVVPTAIRPALSEAVARMLKEYGFTEE
jgi:hypothetical protein